MKKILSLLLIIFVLFSLCACGTDASTDANVELPSNGKKGPSQDLIQSDIEVALSEIPNAILTGVSTVKSLTEDNYYEITVQVTAVTNYADWQLQYEMSYMKYDQGWMLEEINWTQRTVDQTRYPNDSTMIEYAANILTSHDEYADIYYADYMLPMYDPTIEIIDEPAMKAIKICWNSREMKKHNYILHLFSSYWVYEPSIDNWLLIEDVEKDNEEYCLDFERIGIMPGNYDFTGEWTQELSAFEKEIGIVNRIIISDFSWEKLEAYIPELEEYIDIDPYFNFVGEEFGILKFENCYGQTINFQFGEEWTNVYFCVPEYDIAQATARVYVDLPPLS